MRHAPCKDCRNRHMGCHSVCDSYAEWVEYRKELKEKNNIENETSVRSFRINNIYRSIKRKGKKR